MQRFRPVLTLLISLSLVLPLAGLRVAIAQNRITMVIGRPNIWSLGQAHYLLANLRNTNRALSVTSPQLNPNSINGARLNVLRTLLGVEAQVSTPQALLLKFCCAPQEGKATYSTSSRPAKRSSSM